MNTERKPSIEEQALAFGMGITPEEVMDMMGQDYCSINDALSALRHYHEFTPISPSPSTMRIDSLADILPREVTDEEIVQVIRNHFHGFSDEQWEELKTTFPYAEIPFIVRDFLTNKEEQK